MGNQPSWLIILAETARQAGMVDSDGIPAQVFVVPAPAHDARLSQLNNKTISFVLNGNLDMYVGHLVNGINEIVEAQSRPVETEGVLSAGGSLGGMLAMKAHMLLEDPDRIRLRYPFVAIHPSGMKKQGRNRLLGAFNLSSGNMGERLEESGILPFQAEEEARKGRRLLRLARTVGAFVAMPLLQLRHLGNDADDLSAEMVKTEEGVLAISGRDFVSCPLEILSMLRIDPRILERVKIIDTNREHDIFGEAAALGEIVLRSIDTGPLKPANT
ncbi:hypothetical protein KBF61_00825 [Candidatus Saccharibacteria bacterium]|nr:hypothetical protein [Candidatus Saccharibacteria bacterium]